MLVPAKTLAEAAKAGTDGDDVHLSLGAGAAVGKEGLLGIRSKGKRSTTRLLDAEFPKFRQLLPSEHTAIATIGVAELTEAIKRVALVADRGAQVRMEFADDVLRLSAGADDVGRAEEDLPVEFSGDPLTIAFNPTYLTDGLGSLHSERVTFGFTTPSRPAVLRPAGEDDGSCRRKRPVPGGPDRLRLSVDAGAASGLTGPIATKEARTCNWVWSAWARWASTCANACARVATRSIGYDPRPEVTDVPTLGGAGRGARRTAGGVGDGAVGTDHRRDHLGAGRRARARATW